MAQFTRHRWRHNHV